MAQLKAVGFTLAYSGIVSAILFKVVDLVIGLRVPQEQEREGPRYRRRTASAPTTSDSTSHRHGGNPPPSAVLDFQDGFHPEPVLFFANPASGQTGPATCRERYRREAVAKPRKSAECKQTLNRIAGILVAGFQDRKVRPFAEPDRFRPSPVFCRVLYCVKGTAPWMRTTRFTHSSWMFCRMTVRESLSRRVSDLIGIGADRQRRRAWAFARLVVGARSELRQQRDSRHTATCSATPEL